MKSECMKMLIEEADKTIKRCQKKFNISDEELSKEIQRAKETIKN